MTSYETEDTLYEEILQLKYPEGWQEILTAIDAMHLQLWINQLLDIANQELSERDDAPIWARSEQGTISRWQRAIEIVADTAVEGAEELTAAQKLEAALFTVTTNIESIGWRERGLAFAFPELDSPTVVEVEKAPYIDIRDMQSYLPPEV